MWKWNIFFFGCILDITVFTEYTYIVRNLYLPQNRKKKSTQTLAFLTVSISYTNECYICWQCTYMVYVPSPVKLMHVWSKHKISQEKKTLFQVFSVLLMPQYSWNTAQVGIKCQSICLIIVLFCKYFSLFNYCFLFQMFMKAHFNYDPQRDRLIPSKDAGLPFSDGDILHILSSEDPNWWQVII